MKYFSRFKNKSKEGVKGFTLIELLVVIAIVGFLTSIVFASLSVSRQRAQDAQIIASFKQLQNALELYYSQFGQYPLQKTVANPDGVDINDLSISALNGQGPAFRNGLNPLVTNKFISQIVDYPGYPNNTKYYFEYETDLFNRLGTWWNANNTYGCGGVSTFSKLYVLYVGSPSATLSLPHVTEIAPDGSVTDRYNSDSIFSFGPPFYYYCVTSP